MVPSAGVLLLIGLAAAVAGIVVVVVMLRFPPLPPSRLCAALTVVFGSLAAAVYCYGWLSVTLGGPFPEMCESRSASGAGLARIEQEYWPLRNACVYADGATSEYLSPSVDALVRVLAGLAVVAACTGVVLRRRGRSSARGPAGTRPRRA
ncbi:hypothetical protein [Streptomyces abyssomicinicus]|uniref:hypothetical protein n=1 Tax=Streptomyces abyssomicinicus TaxID=574929 RepID=UPI0012508E8E|nr:hypothetical protein [Streptomyces abyssomicinicus]